MKMKKRRVKIFTHFFLLIGLANVAPIFAESALVIRGFYLGMPLKEAVDNFHKVTNNNPTDFKFVISGNNDKVHNKFYVYAAQQFFKELQESKDPEAQYAVSVIYGEVSFMLFNEQKKLIELCLGTNDVNYVFNIKNIDFINFLQGFSNAYNIKLTNNMKGCGKVACNGNFDYEYNNFEEGVDIKLGELLTEVSPEKRRTLIFKTIPKKDDMKF
jgi:hypothetical protein